MTEKVNLRSVSNSTRVFLDELPWDIRSHNTDWRYVRFDLMKLAEYEPSLELILQSSRWVTARENLRVVRDAIGRRAGLLPKRGKLTSTLSTSDLAASGARVVFSHRAFPLNVEDIPVVWQNSILDPEMQLSYGASQRDIDEETEAKRKLYHQAAAIQVSTEAETRRLRATFPEIADRFIDVPFFTPHVRACESSALQRHFEPGPTRLLFTGNQTWRKGLDLLLEAFLDLPHAVQQKAELTIISNFVPPAVNVPEYPQVKVLRGVGPERVMQEMSRSHIFINVARFESYGLVFHEAMSQGLACLAPNWEVQRELLDNGAAGRLLRCEPRAIRSALEELITDPQQRYALGAAAWERFREKYAPAVVARRYAKMFERVARQTIR